MPPSLLSAIAQSWTIPLWPTLATLLTALVYLRGWRRARATRTRELPAWRAVCFLGGLLAVWLALASPLDALDEFLLTAHMTQHLLLMSIGPPLLLLGNPVVPMLRGLPRSLVRDELAPWMNTRLAHALEWLFTNPVFGWISMDLAVVLWHMPPAYELALRSNFWHQIEHACFFFTSLAFWWYVVRPWPNRIRSSRWLIIPYVATSHLVLFFVGLVIALDSHVIYPTYGHVPRLFGVGVMTDQALAGGEMIIVGLTVIIVTLTPILLDLLDRPDAAKTAPASPSAEPAPEPAPFDLLRTPVASAVLRSRYGRPALQMLGLAVVVAVIADGLWGVQLAPMNLAGAALWNIVRPLSLILLLFVANVFCMACPFTLPREAVRKLGLPQFRWPDRLSSKWPAAVLMVLFFWAYEQFALWNSPRDTALLLIGYVAAATLINGFFRGASFCKYLCPVGQFNFVASIFAPAEIGTRSQAVCADCATHDCIRGHASQRGCELKLYLPNKVGNLDCTLCMDCVHACPSDNVSLTLHSPLRELDRDPPRSSVGRLSMRTDLATLILVVVFSSLANAAVMIAPVAHTLQAFEQRHTWAANWLISLLATGALCGALGLLYLGAARILQSLTNAPTLRAVFCRFAVALLPLGLAIWLGHLVFHLATAWPAVPALWDHLTGSMAAPLPHRMMAMSSGAIFSPFLGPNGFNLFDLQVWIVNLGLFVAWYAGAKAIRQTTAKAGRFGASMAAWCLASTALYALAVWIFSQPMYMRGMSL